MSKIKQLIDIDNNELDLTQYQQATAPHNFVTEPVDVPDEYFAINDIHRAIEVLKTCLIAPNEAPLLREQAKQLIKLADIAEKPF
jgi:hypothetical protein